MQIFIHIINFSVIVSTALASPPPTPRCSTADYQIVAEQFQKCKTELSQNNIDINALTKVEWQACPYNNYLSDCIRSMEEDDFKKISSTCVSSRSVLHFHIMFNKELNKVRLGDNTFLCRSPKTSNAFQSSQFTFKIKNQINIDKYKNNGYLTEFKQGYPTWFYEYYYYYGASTTATPKCHNKRLSNCTLLTWSTNCLLDTINKKKKNKDITQETIEATGKKLDLELKNRKTAPILYCTDFDNIVSNFSTNFKSPTVIPATTTGVSTGGTNGPNVGGGSVATTTGMSTSTNAKPGQSSASKLFLSATLSFMFILDYLL